MAKININLDSLKPKREWKRHKVQPGHNVYRFCPPFGDDSNGYPYKKWMISWGLLDPESGRMRPFASSLTTEKKCPIVEYVNALTAKVESMKAELKAKGVSDSDIKDQLKELNGLISTIRPKTVYAYNAVNKAGEVGILEIKSTAQKKLKELMMEYIKDYNQDPTSLNSNNEDSGVWFDVVRSGDGFDTEYDVKKVQNKVKGANGIGFEDDRAALPDNVVENFADMAYDLTSIYQVKSYDDLRQVVLANIARIAETLPEAVVPGFDTFGSPAAKTAPAATQTKTKPATTVKLKLEDGDDEEEAPKVNKKATAASTTSVEDDDIFKMADDILNT